MNVSSFNEEVLYATDRVVRVDAGDIEELKSSAARNPRKRIRLCGHRSTGDSVHEMLIVHARGTYVPPHRHLGKSESFHVIEGSADVVIFSDEGEVAEVVEMGEAGSGRAFFYRLSDPSYHTLLIHSAVFVFHETTNGPFVREETQFADWAPAESDADAAEKFITETAAAVAAFRARR